MTASPARAPAPARYDIEALLSVQRREERTGQDHSAQPKMCEANLMEQEQELSPVEGDCEPERGKARPRPTIARPGPIPGTTLPPAP